MNELIKLFNSHLDLNEEEIQFIRDHSEIQTYPKNQVLLAEGAVSKAFYFVIKGCLRLYYLSNGEEKTAFFYAENMFVSSFLSFTKQLPSTHYIATIEASTLVRFDFRSVENYISYSPKFSMLARIMMEEELAIYQKIIASFVTMNAEQRYLAFAQEHGDLLQRIPQHHIATYLGVSPETLSRIRKRIAER